MFGKVHIYQEFFTYDQAREFMLRTLTIYDPMAYDTSVSLSKIDRMYVVQGHRYASAD
jgi:hypothetical protein